MLTLDDIKSLPRRDMTTELRCIEGWSIIVHWTGARLADLMAQLPPPEFLISAEDTPRGKPDPAGYRLAAERLDALAGECLAIEDSPAGIRAARDAGMFVLGVTNTHAPAELRGAHAIIASLMRLDVSANPLQDVRRVRVRWKDGIEDLQDPA